MIVAADEAIDVAIHDPGREPSEFLVYGEVFFLVVYTIEFMLKLWRYRWYFFCDHNWKYNWLDFVLLVTGYLYVLFDEMLANLTWFRMVRILKLAKALRVLRLIAFVKPLRAILQALAHTFDKLAWSIVMLTMILLMFSLFLVLRLTAFLEEEESSSMVPGPSGQIDVADAIEMHYNSIGNTMIVLFMVVTGGNDWSSYYYPLVPTGVVNWMLFLFFVAFSQIALLNIILGVFVDAAIKDMAADHEETAEANAEHQKEVTQTLRDMCYELDTDEDRKLSSAEWHRALRKPKIEDQLEMMNFRVSEVRELLDHMCTEAQEDAIDIEAFVDTVMRFKGSSSCYDIQLVLSGIQELKMLYQDSQKVQ
jgi:hypothetical protein